MMSLDNVFNDEELAAWVDRVEREIGADSSTSCASSRSTAWRST